MTALKHLLQKVFKKGKTTQEPKKDCCSCDHWSLGYSVCTNDMSEHCGARTQPWDTCNGYEKGGKP